MVSRYKSTYNFIYGPDESTTVPASIFMKLENIQQHYVWISCREFNVNRTINTVDAVRISSTPLKEIMAFTTMIFTKIAITQ